MAELENILCNEYQLRGLAIFGVGVEPLSGSSCWQIDPHFRSWASIYMPALTRILDRLQEGDYDN